MNTSQIKAYAPQARNDFIQAVTERANQYGIFDDQTIEPLEVKGDIAMIGGRPFTQKEGDLRQKLVARVKRQGFHPVMEACAYTWFNRFVALRYMELHDYLEHGMRVFSNPGGADLPEILENASEIEFEGLPQEKIIALRLAGDKDNELYRLLIIAQCNALHKAMPFLFDRIDSETELLLPDNLLHTHSPMRKLVNAIDEESWKDVEIIGWIYQFYISEKKDQVIGKVVKSEDIPAATQLFTPNWIVKYMVQNTLGRMWLATYPDSELRDKMAYYIAPAEQEPEVQAELDRITPRELNPEAITFLDPACGSGHILVEAYAVFKAIYLERGYRTRDIPRLILANNLFGLDICDRAAQLAGFALLMKAREDDRRILARDDLKLNVIAIQESDESDLKNVEIFFKDDEDVRDGLKQVIKLFEDAKTFGSLITVPDNLIGKKNEQLEAAIQKSIDEVFRIGNVESLLVLLQQGEILETKYDCVVTNPPYMGGKGMNKSLKHYAKTQYPVSKADIFAMLTERSIFMAKNSGYIGLVMPYVWMFLSTYEKFRDKVISNATLNSLIQLEYNAFEPACVPVATFTLFRHPISNYKGDFIKLSDFKGHQNQAPKTLEAIQYPDCDWRHTASMADFNKIPGSPIAYWIHDKLRSLFENSKALCEIAPPKHGMTTGNNEKFLRFWHEVSKNDIFFGCKTRENCLKSKKKWYPYNKGGGFRKWFGFNDYLINWKENGKDIKNGYKNGTNSGARILNEKDFFKECVTWGDVTSGPSSFRYSPPGALFDGRGSSLFSPLKLNLILGILNSTITKELLKAINPTLTITISDLSKLPIINLESNTDVVSSLIKISHYDWDFYENSWDFAYLPLLKSDHYQPQLSDTYEDACTHWEKITREMQRLEEQNNRIFIEAYGLQDELTPDVPLSEITLTCNPHYRYGGNKTEEELEALLQTDTIKELISYAIGCMMGRYRLDRPGLIYAHAGNKDFDKIYFGQGADNTEKATPKNALRPLRLCGESQLNGESQPCGAFQPDDDGIIPIMDQEWFADDAANRFIDFLKVAWSPETLEENLQFVADSLKPKRNEAPADTIRRYLSTQFFKDHLKTYKKRPIYWLFASGKQRAFQCLVYLHRYNESTLARMRSAYVTPLQGHFSARIEFLQTEKEAAKTASAQRKIQKEIERLRNKHAELRQFDDELRHYADRKIALDLDDGVKVNYGKFGNLLAQKQAVTGKK